MVIKIWLKYSIKILFLIFLFQITAIADRRFVIGDYPLSLTGRQIKIEKEEKSVSCGYKAKLQLTFKNAGSKPIIICHKNLWLGGVSISRSQDVNPLYDGAAWLSVWGKQSRDELRKKLDQPAPPRCCTLILNPGESWDHEDYAYFEIMKYMSLKNDILWLKVTLEMWPVNAEPAVDPDNIKFGMELQRRWGKYGNLWLDYLESQPIKLDLNGGS